MAILLRSAIVLVTLCFLSCGGAATAVEIFVSVTGNDAATGARDAPFRTLRRAQVAARAAAADMKADVVVNLAPGVIRLQQTLEFTEADSGRNGFTMVYRSVGGAGKARILGSVPLKGWKPYRDGIWQIDLSEGTLFHTLYENGHRAWKARFPNYEHHPDMPTARGRYLVSEDGSPKSKEGERTGWLVYRPEDAPPVTTVRKMLILLFSEGKCDWFRAPRKVLTIDPKTRRVTFEGSFGWGVKAQARFFFEDEMAFLDAPGEFYVDELAHTLYYMPMGKGHPDSLGITAPVVKTLIRIQGHSRDQCVEHLRIEGFTLEQTDGFPITWWGTSYGLHDGALVWMRNTDNIEIRNCHLRNSGRNGIMMIGQNTNNLVACCWIEHMGVNGVTLCNRFATSKKTGPNRDQCEHNRIHDCRMHDIGELHTYAACVNVFNASYNEVDHCELHDAVRYAVTVRGNTGPQYGPPVWTTQPPTKGNRIHHLRIYRCGQDAGDMGALHCADLNNPGGGCVNFFEQITVADIRAIPSMKDISPDGIFLDWPKMSMDQVFRNVQIIRCQGRQLRSNRPDNATSAQTENVSWKSEFDQELMDYEQIGLTDEFPAEFGDRPPLHKPLSAPGKFTAKAVAYDRVQLAWEVPSHPAGETVVYTIFRDGKNVAKTQAVRYMDGGLSEHGTHRYSVAAQTGDFTKLGAPTEALQVRTPSDLTRPALTGARLLPDGRHVRVAFDEPIDPVTARQPGNYRFVPNVRVTAAKLDFPESVEIEIAGLDASKSYTLAVDNVSDRSAAHNAVDSQHRITLGVSKVIASFPLEGLCGNRLRDASGGGGDARLHGNAVVEPSGGPFDGAALRLNGQTGFAEAPADLNLGAGDFTIMAWIYRENSGTILSKGNGFGSPQQWSWGWQKDNVPLSISLRVNNRFLSSAAGSVPRLQWVHVAFVKHGGTGQPYVNGQPSGEAYDMIGFGPFVNTCPLRIGRRDYKPNPAYFKGKIAGLTLFNYALSPESLRAAAKTPIKGRQGRQPTSSYR